MGWSSAWNVVHSFAAHVLGGSALKELQIALK